MRLAWPCSPWHAPPAASGMRDSQSCSHCQVRQRLNQACGCIQTTNLQFHLLRGLRYKSAVAEPLRPKATAQVGLRLEAVYVMAAEPLLYSLCGSALSYRAVPQLILLKSALVVAIGAQGILTVPACKGSDLLPQALARRQCSADCRRLYQNTNDVLWAHLHQIWLAGARFHVAACLAKGLFLINLPAWQAANNSLHTYCSGRLTAVVQAGIQAGFCLLPLELATRYVPADSSAFVDYQLWCQAIAAASVMSILILSPLYALANRFLAPILLKVGSTERCACMPASPHVEGDRHEMCRSRMQ